MKNYGGFFDYDKELKKINELEFKISEEHFWDDKRTSENIINELNYIKKLIGDLKNLIDNINNNLDLLKMCQNEEDEILEVINSEIPTIKDALSELEIKLLLSDEYDKNDCTIEIHPGAGGTESQDWALMLKRMYLRWCDKKGYKYEILDEQIGEEAGIKSVIFLIHGLYAYGNLKYEKGVHRLVRLSPFDSNNRRHTSFASVDVTPLFDAEKINIDINPADLKIDVYRSSGKGGQGVNTTDSAVRITHLPTKIVVTCQNERSQIQNKEKALEVLKSKLYRIEEEKKKQELQDFKGELSDINFGSQIRSYVMHPYSLVKDNRTGTQTSDVVKVLDGDIDNFIYDNLKGVKASDI